MATSEDRHLQSTAARPPDKGWVMNMEKKQTTQKRVKQGALFLLKGGNKRFEKNNVLQLADFC